MHDDAAMHVGHLKVIYVFYNLQPVSRDAMQVGVWG